MVSKFSSLIGRKYHEERPGIQGGQPVSETPAPPSPAAIHSGVTPAPQAAPAASSPRTLHDPLFAPEAPGAGADPTDAPQVHAAGAHPAAAIPSAANPAGEPFMTDREASHRNHMDAPAGAIQAPGAGQRMPPAAEADPGAARPAAGTERPSGDPGRAGGPPLHPPSGQQDRRARPYKQAGLQDRRVGEILVELGVSTGSQINRALDLQKAGGHRLIGDILVQAGFVTQQELQEALDIQARRSPAAAHAEPRLNRLGMAEVLLQLGVKPSHIKAALDRSKTTDESLALIMRDFGFLSAEQVAQATAILSGYPFFAAEAVEKIDIRPILGLNLRLDHYRGFVPVSYAGKTLTVAVADLAVVNDARNAFMDYSPRIVIAAEQTLQAIYKKWFSNTEQAFDAALRAYLEILRDRRNDPDKHPGLLRDLLGTLLRHACYNGASDIYLRKSEYVGVLSLKVNGVGSIFRSIPAELYERLINRLIMEANIKNEDLRRGPREGTVWFSLEEDIRRYADVFTRYAFRLELAETRGAKTAVIRILDKQASAADFSTLGFDEATSGTLQEYLQANAGLILVTGPTGSGKTTTLYAMLKEIDPVERSIQSIENPIEYRHGLWMQYEISRQAADEGEEWNKWLKGLLRNAPDIILLGEVRDAGTARTLLDAANTGHLVFTTLHTNNAVSALARLKRLGVDMDSLAAELRGVLAQRLLRTLCDHCKVADTAAEAQAEMMAEFLQPFARQPFKASPGGCPECSFTGYRGRRIVYELLDASAEVKKLIESNAPASRIATAGIRPGYSMWDCGLKLVAQGVTSMAELRRVAMREAE